MAMSVSMPMTVMSAFVTTLPVSTVVAVTAVSAMMTAVAVLVPSVV